MYYPEEFFKIDNLNLWFPEKDDNQFEYSEGIEEENYLESCISKASDLSCHSPELSRCIKDWSSNYHLSPKRSNLLRPLLLNRHHSILELGAGCGAITRYFGENTGKVVAVEGSKKRAKIAALRCRDLGNVQVVQSDFTNLKLTEKFDVVTLVGVLEYSGKYLVAEDPYQQVIEIARSYLKEDGILIIAIENKLGLKYFAGSAEDHTGVIFDGLEGYCSNSSFRTFGKKELESLVKSLGFECLSFLYPFPDYKLPEVIFKIEESSSFKAPFLYQWLSYENLQDYFYKRIEGLQEFLVSKQIEANGLLSHLSNSFLLITSFEQESIDRLIDEQRLVYKYNTTRVKEFMTQIFLTKDDKNSLVFNREPLYPDLSLKYQATDNVLKHNPYETTKPLSGIILMEQFLRAIKSKEVKVEESLKSYLKIWHEFLLTEARQLLNSETDIPGVFVDCTFWNLMLTSEGKIEYIDREWQYLERLPIKFILFRGILYTYEKLYPYIDYYLGSLLSDRTFQSFLGFCLKLIDCNLTSEEFDKFLEWEWNLQNQISMNAISNFDDYVNGLKAVPPLPLNLGILKKLQEQLQQTQTQFQQTQTQLQQTQTQLQQTQTQLDQSAAQLQFTQEQLQQTQTQLQQTHIHLHQTHTQLIQTQGQLQQSKDVIEGMESSKFWKLRSQWIRLKGLLLGKSLEE